MVVKKSVENVESLHNFDFFFMEKPYKNIFTCQQNNHKGEIKCPLVLFRSEHYNS